RGFFSLRCLRIPTSASRTRSSVRSPSILVMRMLFPESNSNPKPTDNALVLHSTLLIVDKPSYHSLCIHLTGGMDGLHFTQCECNWKVGSSTLEPCLDGCGPSAFPYCGCSGIQTCQLTIRRTDFGAWETCIA